MTQNAMKKLTALLLSLMLAALALPALAEAGGFGDRNLFMRAGGNGGVPEVSAIAAVGDALYMLAGADIYRYLAGDGEPSLFFENANLLFEPENGADGGYEISYLFELDGCLYGAGFRGQSACRITKLSDEGGAPVKEPLCELSMNGVYGEYADEARVDIGGAFASGGRFYLTGTENATGAGVLYEFELTDGAEGAPKKLNRLSRLAPYKDGLLLGVANPGLGEASAANTLLMTYDLAAEKETAWLELGEGLYGVCAAWSRAEDAVYYIVDTAVYRLADAASEPLLCAYMPERCNANPVTCLQGGSVAMAGYSGVYLRAPDLNGAAAHTLIVSGEYGSDEHMAAVAEHPELSIAASSGYMQGLEAFTNAMISGGDGVDVFLLSLADQSVQSLIAKGYALELNRFPEVMAIAEQMDERLLAPFRKDGRLYALPVRLHSNVLGVNRKLWTETLGLSPDALPSTYFELLDFIANYFYDYGEEHEEIALSDSWSLKRDLLHRILESEIATQLRDGEARLSFDSERFRRLMTALEEIDFSEISIAEMYGDNASQDKRDEFAAKETLFSAFCDCNSPRALADGNRAAPLPLAMEEGATPVLPANMDVLLISPRTELPEAAAAYIASYAGHLNRSAAALTLFPSRNDAVTNPRYESELAAMRERIARLETALEAASEENKAEIREELGWEREELANYEHTGGVLVSAELIAAYREQISPYLYPMEQTPLTTYDGNEGSSIQSLLNQFIAGSMKADAFVRELDGRVRLMLLEGE